MELLTALIVITVVFMAISFIPKTLDNITAKITDTIKQIIKIAQMGKTEINKNE